MTSGGLGRPGKSGVPVTGPVLEITGRKIRVILIGHGGLKTDAVELTKTRVCRVPECEYHKSTYRGSVTAPSDGNRGGKFPRHTTTPDISLDVEIFEKSKRGVLM